MCKIIVAICILSNLCLSASAITKAADISSAILINGGSQSQKIVQITGRVSDTNLNVITNAKVSITSRGVPKEKYTDSRGIFDIRVELVSGISYSLLVEKEGFKKFTRVLSANPDGTFDFQEVQLTKILSTRTGKGTPSITHVNPNKVTLYQQNQELAGLKSKLEYAIDEAAFRQASRDASQKLAILAASPTLSLKQRKLIESHEYLFNFLIRRYEAYSKLRIELEIIGKNNSRMLNNMVKTYELDASKYDGGKLFRAQYDSLLEAERVHFNAFSDAIVSERIEFNTYKTSSQFKSISPICSTTVESFMKNQPSLEIMLDTLEKSQNDAKAIFSQVVESDKIGRAKFNDNARQVSIRRELIQKIIERSESSKDNPHRATFLRYFYGIARLTFPMGLSCYGDELNLKDFIANTKQEMLLCIFRVTTSLRSTNG
ncbi:carboxypeptidase-like regulatory domain-containing protein [Hymenobacter sp. HD11105]